MFCLTASEFYKLHFLQPVNNENVDKKVKRLKFWLTSQLDKRRRFKEGFGTVQDDETSAKGTLR